MLVFQMLLGEISVELSSCQGLLGLLPFSVTRRMTLIRSSLQATYEGPHLGSHNPSKDAH